MTQHPVPASSSYIEIPQLEETMSTLIDHVRSMNDLLHDLAVFLKTNAYPKETEDIFQIVTLYKAGFGTNWVPSLNNRVYMRVYAPVATAVLVTSPLGPPFVVTIPAANPANLWNHFDFPDQSSFILDTSASANSMSIYTRRTMVTD